MTPNPNPIPPDFVALLHRHYDVATLRAWIARYESDTGKRQQAQVARWRRTLLLMENVEISQDGLRDGYTK